MFLYADDVVLFLAPRHQDLILTRGILEIFARASGLSTNINKCLISPIQCDLEATVTLMNFFPGKIDPFPITYLGIPLALRKLGNAELQPLVDKVASRLPTWKANLQNRAGRTVLIKSTLSAIPTHIALVINISPLAIKCIDKRRRTFLWKGADSVRGGHCLLAWPKVCRLPELGGLGIVDLELFGYALRLRWLWVRRPDDERPWYTLPDSQEPVVEAMFKASTYMEVGDGNRALFWVDKWLGGRAIEDIAPCLYMAVGTRIRNRRTVAQALHGDQWVHDIRRRQLCRLAWSIY